MAAIQKTKTFLAEMSTGGAKKIFLIVPTDFKVILSIDVIPQIYSGGGGIYIQYTHTKHFINY